MRSPRPTRPGHGRGSGPLDAPGSQDITSDVPLGYLRTVAANAGFALVEELTQAEWLHRLGIDDLVADGSATWEARAHLGDLEAIRGRSRISEGAALVDPTGLGAHRVVVLHRGAASGPTTKRPGNLPPSERDKER